LYSSVVAGLVEAGPVPGGVKDPRYRLASGDRANTPRLNGEN